jgi:hypothetical protein
MIRLAGALPALDASVATARAQQAPYPNKPITWMLGSGAGGVSDNSARFGNLGHLGPEKLKAFYISESEKFKKVVEKAGVSLD